jgi:hypothetical protein
MKSGLKYIEKIIQFEIGKILNEDMATDNNPVKNAQDQIDYDNNQSNELTADIKKLKNWEALAMSDIKGLQQQQRLTKDPIQKSLATTNLTKVATPKDKDLKTMISNKEDELSKLGDKIKADNTQLNYAKKSIATSSVGHAGATGTGTSNPQGISESKLSKSMNEKTSLPMITRTFAEQEEQNDLSNPNPVNNTPTNKAYLVKFDQNTQAPFDVKFTERGFSINGTRLSFEALENALSKNYTITLNNGKGLSLDAIRMQKILKYKDKWFHGQR